MLASTEHKSRFLGRGAIDVSFEFFPPKTAAMEETLWRSIRRLEPLRPKYVSVTYGAGGSTRERTHATVARILRETTLKPAAHLTCVAATKTEIDEVIRDYWDLGVRHIVALRGDPPGGVGERYEPTPGGYVNAADLVTGIKTIAPFEISVACYPEKHPELPSVEADIDMLKAKIDAGRHDRHHPVLLRQRGVLPLSRPRPRRGHHHSHRAGPHSDPQFQAGARASPPNPARACPTGSATDSKASTTIRRRAIWWPPPLPPSRCWASSTRASPSFISTR